MSGRRPRKAVPVDCAGRDGAVDVGAAAPRESLWLPDFCGNDDGGSDAGDAAMVAVVGSSSACPRFCLGLLVVMESKLRRRGPMVYVLVNVAEIQNFLRITKINLWSNLATRGRRVHVHSLVDR